MFNKLTAPFTWANIQPMIIETSAFFQRPYERAMHPAIKDADSVAEEYRGMPVRIWVGEGFFKFIREEIEPRQTCQQIIGILSGAVDGYFILDPWFDENALAEVQFKKMLGWIKGENAGSLFGPELKDLGISISKYGLAVPVSEITMMSRNPDMMSKSELDRPM